MKPKNVMLMGFVNRAVEYLNSHLNDENNSTLDELKNIDLESLKDELGDEIDYSLGVAQSTMTTLLNAGGAAFDKFIDNHSEEETFSDEINRIFNVNLDQKNPESNKEYLDRLLSYYNLDEDFAVDDSALENKRDVDDVILDKISKNVNKDEDKQEVIDIKNTDAEKRLDDIFNEIVSNEADKKENDQSIFSSLINDLKKQMIYDKASQNKKFKAKLKEIADKLLKIYPYLDTEFISIVYSQKAELAKNYPIDANVIILHRVKFKEVENLRQFVEITMNHGYTINADEDKMIVDVFKQFKNEEDKILNNIFEIANQGFLLKGNYEGYQVIVNDEE